MPKEILSNTGPPEKNIILPIRRLMEEYIIGEPNIDGARARQINPIDAVVIEASKTGFAVIQWNDIETGQKLDKPLLWWKNAWDKVYFNHVRKKQKEAEDRKEWNLLSENTTRIARAMAKKYGIEDAEVFRVAAYKISKQKLEKVAETMGSKLDKG